MITNRWKDLGESAPMSPKKGKNNQGRRELAQCSPKWEHELIKKNLGAILGNITDHNGEAKLRSAMIHIIDLLSAALAQCASTRRDFFSTTIRYHPHQQVSK